MIRTFSFLFVICSLCLSVSAQVAPEAQTLVPGQPVYATEVWVNRGGKWRIVSYTETPVS